MSKVTDAADALDRDHHARPSLDDWGVMADDTQCMTCGGPVRWIGPDQHDWAHCVREVSSSRLVADSAAVDRTAEIVAVAVMVSVAVVALSAAGLVAVECWRLARAVLV